MTTNSERYRAAREMAAWINQSGRVRLRVTGPDRSRFLHNLVTNDVKRLGIGRGCEAFVTSPQGKTLALARLHALSDAVLVRTDPGGMELALPHLLKYGVFDDIKIEDSSSETGEIHVLGPNAEAWLRGIGATPPAEDDLALVETTAAGIESLLIRESPAGGAGFTLIVSATSIPVFAETLREAGIGELDAETTEALRIEAGTPAFGRDATGSNLPQEIDRDARAISFVKGCYLGQETVARLDALGHVNKILRRLVARSEDPTPPAGTSLEADGKTIGTVTSSAFSPGRGAGVALGIVRVSHASPGATVVWRRPEDSSGFVLTVDDPPLLPSRF